MRLAKALVVALILVCASSAFAATLTSSFDNFTYAYTVTPDTGEMIRSFKVYTVQAEFDVTHYYDVVMPAGWMFDVVCDGEKCAITWFTEGEPLPEGQIADFSYVHYCAPCCHSWYVSDEGNNNIVANVVDDDEQHSEACNIPAEFADECGGPGLLLAPIYPSSVPEARIDWGKVKAQYR